MKKGHGFADTPVLQREFWNSHTDHQCVKWKPGSLGWQTSFGRPEWAGQCCSERTWWTDHKQHGKILWLHVDEGKSLPTGRATQKSDKLQWSDWWSFILVWCVMWSYDKTKQTEGQKRVLVAQANTAYISRARGKKRSDKTNISWLLLSLWGQEERSVLELKHLVTFGTLHYYRHPVMCSVLPPHKSNKTQVRFISVFLYIRPEKVKIKAPNDENLTLRVVLCWHWRKWSDSIKH